MNDGKIMESFLQKCLKAFYPLNISAKGRCLKGSKYICFLIHTVIALTASCIQFIHHI